MFVPLFSAAWCLGPGVFVYSFQSDLEDQPLPSGTPWKVQQLARSSCYSLPVQLALSLSNEFICQPLSFRDFMLHCQGCYLPTRWWGNGFASLPALR
jgi:hypothetical protein